LHLLHQKLPTFTPLKKVLSIIGGGPAALLLAATVSADKYEIRLYEKNKTVGRKFLVAGDGGFNLTHASDLESMKQQYLPLGFLDNALSAFTNVELRQWLATLGIETFEGSSHRVFPVKGIKPIQVLDSILDILKKKGVLFFTQHNWQGWDNKGNLLFENKASVKSDVVVFALGGASWKVTGSDGTWLELFSQKGIKVKPFMASNCAFQTDWQKDFIENNEGKPLKNITLSIGSKKAKGELIVSQFGLEGNAIYALSNDIQQAIKSIGYAEVFLDLKPSNSVDELITKLQKGKAKNRADLLKNELNLNSTQVQILKSVLSKEDYLSDKQTAFSIKNLKLRLGNPADIDEAISTTGGIDLEEVTSSFELKKLPKHFCIGEMLDWDAPTGGYLLQACMSMGVFVGKGLNGEG